MGLLALEHVTVRYRRGDRGRLEHVALRDVSMRVDAGELVAVLGRRRSGRTTLLEVAAGMVRPSEGSVLFDGLDLTRRCVLGEVGGIGHCDREFSAAIGETVVEHVAAPLLSGPVSPIQAQADADAMLERVGAADCADLRPEALGHAEATRVSIARALITRPRLLVLDEPTKGARVTEEDDLLALLGAVAHQDGIAVLMTVDHAAGLSGADRALTIDNGELRGEREPAAAEVLPLDAARARRS